MAPKPVVLITGGSGNLGVKAAAALRDVASEVRLLDPKRPSTCGVEWTEADLTCWEEGASGWPTRFAGVDCVLHLATVNPFLDETWDQSAASVRMHAHVIRACERHKVPRLVFFSSNHVMGALRLQGPGLAEAAPIPAGQAMSPATRFRVWGETTDAMPYAAAKAAGESMCAAAAEATALEVVVLRIGWCQPGDNRPQTLSATGQPPGKGTGSPPPCGAGDDDPDAVQRWFRLMWLSNPDFAHLMRRCVLAPAPLHPALAAGGGGRFFVVNGMSRNTGMRWDLGSGGAKAIGYSPRDDVAQHFAKL